MSLEPTLEEQALLADALDRDSSEMTRRELLSGVLAGAGFVLAALVLWLLDPPHFFAQEPALLCLLVVILASRVAFDTPFGFTVLTQLAFVPLLFSMSPAVAPVAVAVALAVARLPDVLRGRVLPTRMIQAAANSWFVVGPVAVFAVAGTEPRHAGAVLLLAALISEFLLDFLVSCLRNVLSWKASFMLQIRETWVYAIDGALSGVGLLVAALLPSYPAAVLALLPLLGLFAVLAQERRQRLEGLVELNGAYRGTALVLGEVVEADDGYTGEHCQSVVALCLTVADHMNLSAQQRRNLEFGALLHDVGKIAVPKSIINKPGKLDPEEWSIIKTHTIEGQRMLSRVGGFMRDVGEIVRSHHERWDGAGYPDRLAGEQIRLEARIISCCDTWNAMRTDRSYRQALPYEAAAQEMRRVAGSQLDPRIVEVMLEVVKGEATAPAPKAAVQDARPGGEPISAPEPRQPNRRAAFHGPPVTAAAATNSAKSFETSVQNSTSSL